VSVTEVTVNLKRIRELNGCFLQLALVGVPLAALKIALLFLVGIAMAAHGKTKCERDGQNC